MTTRQVIHRLVTLHMTSPITMTVRGFLRYDPDDPAAVSLGLRDPVTGEDVVWRFARELLHEGLIQPAGEGDVIIAPLHVLGEPDLVEIVITGFDDDGDPSVMTLTMQRNLALRFIRRSYMEVPASVESHLIEPQVDELLEEIMRRADTP